MRFFFGGDGFTNAGLFRPEVGFHAALWEPNNGTTSHRGIVAWTLYKVQDADGNYYRVQYDNNRQALVPASIEYNLPKAGASASSFQVAFD
jgi:hypothetical protein